MRHVVVLYTATGGLKATFLTDYLHTAVALILIIYFTLSVLTNEAVGGLGGLWEKLMANSKDNYVDGNYQGSLLTMKSKGAILWALILKFGNLALVVMVCNHLKSRHPMCLILASRILRSGKSPLPPKSKPPSQATTWQLLPSSAFHGVSVHFLENYPVFQHVSRASRSRCTPMTCSCSPKTCKSQKLTSVS